MAIQNAPRTPSQLRCTASKFSASVIDTASKFSAGVIDTGGKFSAGVTTINVDRGKHVIANFGVTFGKFAAGVNGVGVKFSAGVNDTGNAPLVVNTFANF